jgi:small subunit ribosomal protein S18
MSEDKREKREKKGGKVRRKVCHYCVTRALTLDYKNTEALKPYLKERGKIAGRRSSGFCAKHQRQLTRAVKRARQLALVSYETR